MFSGGFGFFSNFKGGLTKKCGEGFNQHSFLGETALCSGDKFSQGGGA